MGSNDQMHRVPGTSGNRHGWDASKMFLKLIHKRPHHDQFSIIDFITTWRGSPWKVPWKKANLVRWNSKLKCFLIYRIVQYSGHTLSRIWTRSFRLCKIHGAENQTSLRQMREYPPSWKGEPLDQFVFWNMKEKQKLKIRRRVLTLWNQMMLMCRLYLLTDGFQDSLLTDPHTG